MRPRTNRPQQMSPSVGRASNGSRSRRRPDKKPAATSSVPRILPQAEWPGIIPARQWAEYRLAMEAARKAGIRFLVGGGFSLAAYTGRWRNTKDIDLYIRRSDCEAMISALSGEGFVDYFDERPYDRGWIYRSVRNKVIVDIIWSMANRRAGVDKLWFERARAVAIREETVQLVPVEELLWCKLYILQRDHCDWPDVFNLLYATGVQLDWRHLLERVGADSPLLRATLTVFDWLCPGRAAELPMWMRRRMGLGGQIRGGDTARNDRINLLDRRKWFAAFQPKDQNLEV